MEENVVDYNAQLVDLLNKLSEIQMQIASIVSTKFDRQTRDVAQENINKVINNISVEAQRYGQKPQTAEKTIADYEEAIAAVRREFESEKNLWLAQSAEFQNKEIQSVLNIADEKAKAEKEESENEIQTDTANMEKTNGSSRLKEQLKIARESGDSALNGVLDCSKRCIETVDSLSEVRELVKVDEKNNIFRTIFSKISDKIGGKEKFNKNVIMPLESKTSFIKDEVVPDTKKKIKEGFITELKGLLAKGVEKTVETTAEAKFGSLMETAMQGASMILTSSLASKTLAISALVAGGVLAVKGAEFIAKKISEKKDKENEELEENTI